MINQLLGIFVGTILPIIILILAIVVAIFLYKKMRKKFNIPLDKSIKQNPVPQVSLRKTYCTEEEMRFLEALHKALPRECISFPKVGLDNIIDPKGNVNGYNKLLAKYADVCVFLRDGMKPILIIDLFSKGSLAQKISKLDENVLKMLKLIKIPVIQIELQDTYIVENLKADILNAMNSDVIAGMKDKIIKTIQPKNKG